MSVVPVDALIKAIEGLHFLYNNGLNPNNAADKNYATFSKKVKNFIQSGRRLHGTITYATRSASGGSSNTELNDQARRLMGEFRSIARQCEIFCREHRSLQSGRPGFFGNLKWNTRQAPLATLLERRMTEHEHDVSFFIDSFDLDARETKLDEMLLLARQLCNVEPERTAESFAMPTGLAGRFAASQSRHPPPAESRMTEALIAAEGHLSQSVRLIEAGQEQSVYGFVDLWKAHWLLLFYKNQLSILPPGQEAMLARKAADVEKDIVRQLKRKDLVQFEEQDFATLPEDAFLLWMSIDLNAPPSESSPVATESLIFDAKLPTPRGTQECRCAVYRQSATKGTRRYSNSSATGNHTGNKIRVVRSWRMQGLSDPKWSVQQISTIEDDVCPTYLFKDTLNDRFRFDLRCNKSATSVRYDFDSEVDLYRFQWALTNFAVATDTQRVKWTLAESMTKRKRMPTGQARVQIWLWDPEDRLSSPSSPTRTNSDASSAGQSSLSTVTSPVYSTLDEDMDNALETSIDNKRKQRKYSTNAKIYQTVASYAPLIVLFDQDEDEPSYLFLEIKEGLSVDRSRCECSLQPHKCKRAVLRRPDKAKFRVHWVRADGPDAESTPSLSLISKSTRRGEGNHPGLSTAEVIETSEIILAFVDVERRQKFAREFTLTHAMRHQAEKADAIVEDVVRHRASVSASKNSPLVRVDTRDSVFQGG